jgi:SAM-dependent methyltransferase
MVYSPHLGDKLTDWQLIELSGGQSLLLDKDIVEYGPCYGLDLLMWTPWARSYTMIESDPKILDHLSPFITALQRGEGVTVGAQGGGKGAAPVRLIDANLQHRLPLPDQMADVVIDFGTVDNVLAGYAPYEEAARLLRPGGVLLITYANLDFFKEPMSACGDEQRFSPGELAKHLVYTIDAFDVIARFAENQPRAGMSLRRNRW